MAEKRIISLSVIIQTSKRNHIASSPSTQIYIRLTLKRLKHVSKSDTEIMSFYFGKYHSLFNFAGKP